MAAYSSGLKITARTVTNPCFDPCLYRLFLRLKISAALLQIHVLIPISVRTFFRPQDYSLHCYKSMLWCPFMFVPQARVYSLHCYKSMLWSLFICLCSYIPLARDYSVHCYTSMLWSMFMFVHSLARDYSLHCYKSMLWSSFVPTRFKIAARTVTKTMLYAHKFLSLRLTEHTVANWWLEPCFFHIYLSLNLKILQFALL